MSPSPGDPKQPDANGVLQGAYDPTKQALRVSQTGSTGAPSTAHYIVSQTEGALPNSVVFGATVIFPPDVVANRPAASTTIVGALYPATDTQLLYRSDGVSTWTTVAGAGVTTLAALEIGRAHV